MTIREYIRRNWNVPNVLTLIRLLLVPVYIVLFAAGQKYAALAVFLLASLTDWLDGRIARKYNLTTDFGKLMDPLADKVMVITAMCSMAIGSQTIAAVIPWAAVVILLVKEAIMVAGSAVMLRFQMVACSNLVGKTAQCMFIASLVAVYFHDWFVRVCAGWFMPLDLMLLWISIALALCALIVYGTRSLRAAREKGII